MTSTSGIGSGASHHQSAIPLQHSKFIGLARELRNHIYSYLVKPQRSLAFLTGHPSDWFNPNILLTNHQIRSEALEIIYEQKITVLVKPLAESNFVTMSTRVLEGLRFKRCGIKIDLSGVDGDKIDRSADPSTVGFLKGAVMGRSGLYNLVNQLNRMPCLEELHIEQRWNAGVDENSEMDMDDGVGRDEDLTEDEDLYLERLRQQDDAVFLENTAYYFQQIADTVNVTIKGNLNVEDSKRILSLMDGPVFPWEPVSQQGGQTPWRVFAVDATRASCENVGTRVLSKVLRLSTVWVTLQGYRQKEIWDAESAAAIKTFVDGGF